jgi:hypothetical protein
VERKRRKKVERISVRILWEIYGDTGENDLQVREIKMQKK